MPESMPTAGALAGVRVAVTRPRPQCQELLGLLEMRGAYARCLPVVEILPPFAPEAAAAGLGSVDGFDLLLFTSANAVRSALQFAPADAFRAIPGVVGSVGPATAEALQAAGIEVKVQPLEQINSEGLLDQPQLAAGAVRGKRVLIVKGEGGRTLLADTLRARGAEVVSVDVYRRARPGGRIHDLLEEPLEGFGSIVITSQTALEHLLSLADKTEQKHVLNAQLVVLSRRLADAARRRGARRDPIVCAAPSDQAIIEALTDWRLNRDAQIKKHMEFRDT